MGSFVYYNPKTNTIERRAPTQSNPFQIPYLLNIQLHDQELNYAMKNTIDSRYNPSKAQSQDPYDIMDKDYNEYKRSSMNNVNEKENIPANNRPAHNLKNSNTHAGDFFIMEDLREEDIEKSNNSQLPKRGTRMTPQDYQGFSPEKVPSKKTVAFKPTIQDEEEAQGEFKIMKPDELIIKYRPEDYSINERILNTKYVREEQEKTKKFLLDRIGSEIKNMEARADQMEKDLEADEKEAKEIEEKTTKMWQDIERRKFEMIANDVMRKIDEAIDMNKELDDDERLNAFYNQNKALYDEIDKALEEGEEEEEITYVEEARPRPKKKTGYYPKATGSGFRNTMSTFSSKGPTYNSFHTRNKYGLDQALGRKNVVKAVKPQNAVKSKIGNQSNVGAAATVKKGGPVFKNSKKVEEALQKAKSIANLY